MTRYLAGVVTGVGAAAGVVAWYVRRCYRAERRGAG